MFCLRWAVVDSLAKINKAESECVFQMSRNLYMY